MDLKMSELPVVLLLYYPGSVTKKKYLFYQLYFIFLISRENIAQVCYRIINCSIGNGNAV